MRLDDSYGHMKGCVMLHHVLTNTTGTGYELLVHNIKVEFEPYAPTNTMRVSPREANPVGVRFASYVSDAQRDAATEYGWLVSTKAALLDDTNNLFIADSDAVPATGQITVANSAGARVIAVAAYKEGGVDRKYATSGADFDEAFVGVDAIFFTAVLHNIPSERYDEVLVARPYIRVDGKYYFGDCKETSYNAIFN